jgi:hypothetical protein
MTGRTIRSFSYPSGTMWTRLGTSMLDMSRGSTVRILRIVMTVLFVLA